jgi:hypothetical protein
VCKRHCECGDKDDEAEEVAARAQFDREVAVEFLDYDETQWAADTVDCVQKLNANPLLRDAYNLRLPKDVQGAAIRSNTDRQSSDVRSLPMWSIQYVLHCVVAIMLRLLHLWAPNDEPGLYVLVRKRLDGHFMVKAEETAFVRTRVCKTAGMVLRELPKRSRERRAVLGVFAAASKRFGETLLGTDGDDTSSDPSAGASDASSSSEQRPGGKKSTRWALRTARADYRRMAIGQTLERKKHARKRRSDAAVESVVNFLYRSDNTTTLSLGTAPQSPPRLPSHAPGRPNRQKQPSLLSCTRKCRSPFFALAVAAWSCWSVGRASACLRMFADMPRMRACRSHRQPVCLSAAAYWR